MSQHVLRSEVCDLLGIEYPIFLAGMGAVPGMPKTGKYFTGTSIELVAAVSNAGGFGVLGAAALSPDEIIEAARDIQALTSKPFGIDLLFPGEVDKLSQAAVDKARADLPQTHKNYFEWMEQVRVKYGLSQGHVPDYMKNLLNPEFIRAQFEAILKVEGARAVCSAVGTSQWAVERVHQAGKILISLVGNVRQARRVAQMGTDIIVAQGTEAGGHTGQIGTLALIPQVVDAVSPIPVLAAGGIGDARGLAAALALGAKGVWVGTAFLASQETSITPECRQKIIEAQESDTIVTRFFTGKTCRFIRHPIAEAWEAAGFKSLGMPLQGFSVIELCEAMEKTGNQELFMLPTGQVAGMIKSPRPAAEIIKEMVSGAVGILKGGELKGLTIKEA